MPQDKRRFRSWQRCSLLLCLCAGVVVAGCDNVSWSLQESVKASQKKLPDRLPDGYQIYEVGGAKVHVISVPERMEISVAMANELAPLSELADQEKATYAINAGFFDPQNGKTTSNITIDDELVGDPANNERLTENPDLSEYLEQIFNRSEFRTYRCGVFRTQRYRIRFHNDPLVQTGCTPEHAVGAGPMISPLDTSFEEAFTDYENKDPDNGKLIRDAIGGMQRNARSAIGLGADKSVVLFMVEKDIDSVGMTLEELAGFARTLSVLSLLNLDGGSSSSLYVADETPTTYFGRSDDEGSPIERPIKSVIIAK